MSAFFFGSFREREPELDRRIVDELMGLYESGAIRPHISRSFPLEQAGNAIAHLAGRSAMGKVIVTIEA
ncbi:zinc-binding dehydrogenase [Novosphingobium colocasiae]